MYHNVGIILDGKLHCFVRYYEIQNWNTRSNDFWEKEFFLSFTIGGYRTFKYIKKIFKYYGRTLPEKHHFF